MYDPSIIDPLSGDGNKTSRSELSVHFSDSFVVNPLPSKSLARYLRSKPQGIEESHVDISLCMTRSVFTENGQEQLSNAAFLTPAARAFSA